MFYSASATIAQSHPELAEVVSELDAYLAELEGLPVRIETAADILGMPPDRLDRLMGLYLDAGVVTEENGYFCPTCNSLIEHTPEVVGDFWCDVCARTVSFRDRNFRAERVYIPALADARPVVEQPETAGSAITTILFVVGDRGGGQRSLLMPSREEKAIKDAILRSQHRALFRFAHSLHSASLQDVISSHKERPEIFHFAGHGEERKLILLEDRDLKVERIDVQATRLGEFFKHFPCKIRLAYFSTCHSSSLAIYLTDQGVVDLAIGFPGKIADDLAIKFAESFYQLIGDGQPVAQAFGMALLQLTQLDDAAHPVLVAATGVSIETYRFTEPRPDRPAHGT